MERIMGESKKNSESQEGENEEQAAIKLKDGHRQE